MKKWLYFTLILAVMSFSTSVHATSAGGPIKVFEFPQVSGVTVMSGSSADSGVSWVATIDLTKNMGDGLARVYNLSYPHNGRGNDNKSGVTYITFGVNSLSPLGTGNTATAGVTIPYFYAVTNTPKTPREIEALGVSGVTSIVSLPVDSSSSPFQVFPFTPEFGRYLHILVGSSTTDYNRPGAIIAVQ